MLRSFLCFSFLFLWCTFYSDSKSTCTPYCTAKTLTNRLCTGSKYFVWVKAHGHVLISSKALQQPNRVWVASGWQETVNGKYNATHLTNIANIYWDLMPLIALDWSFYCSIILFYLTSVSKTTIFHLASSGDISLYSFQPATL